jgi:hypothetical protein
MTTIVRLGLLIGLLALTPGSSEAQEAPGPIAGEGMTPAQVQQLFDAMLVMQAQEALNLNETQYGQFLTRLKTLQDTRRRVVRERTRLIGELGRLTNPRNPRPGESDIKLRLSELQELESRSAADLRKAYDAIDSVLDAYQQARFRVLEEQIERRKLELVGRARQGNPNRPPPARRPPGR